MSIFCRPRLILACKPVAWAPLSMTIMDRQLLKDPTLRTPSSSNMIHCSRKSGIRLGDCVVLGKKYFTVLSPVMIVQRARAANKKIWTIWKLVTLLFRYDFYEKAVTFRPYQVDMLDPVTANFLGDNLRCWMQIQVCNHNSCHIFLSNFKYCEIAPNGNREVFWKCPWIICHFFALFLCMMCDINLKLRWARRT